MNENLLSNPILRMSINNLNFRTHRQRLRRYLLGGGERGNYRNLLRQYNLVFNYFHDF